MTTATKDARLSQIADTFQKRYGKAPSVTVRAPGRVNLIGEHTDYNEGFVFPVAIDREMIIAATANGSDRINVYSLDYDACDAFVIPTSTGDDAMSAIAKSEKHAWADYLRAVIATLRKRGYKVSGFDAVLLGNVPQGAGLSSSAAYEVAVVTLVNNLDNLGISAKDAALIAQQAENKYIGVQCGIMDQFISALGKEDSALLVDCRSLDFRAVPLNLAWRDYAIVITHSGVQRGLVTSEYNARRAECNEGIQALSSMLGRKLNSLRDIDLAEFEKQASKLSDKVARRCRHVISENKRVLDAVAALESADLVEFGQLLNASHCSLRDDFEVSCPEIDQLVELSQQHDGVLGARITGGGFGGCTVAVVANKAIDSFKDEVIPAYEKLSGKHAEVYICVATDGAQVLEL
ncbi:MAG: galactokinase [Cyanobacteria bacterium REEB67]|nr:galactokinase [Cyanobacteria bacterium REEB67]